MQLREALYTTRSMRRMRPDPISLDVQARIMDAAIRAPNGGDEQSWRFVLVDDREQVAALAPLYRQGVERLWSDVYAERGRAAAADPDAPRSRAFDRMRRSVDDLAARFEEVPLLLFAFAPREDPTGASTIPAVWSAMLAARAEGVGSCFAGLLTYHPDVVFELLGVPAGEGWHLKAVVAFGYPTGRWGVAPRRPVQDVVARNGWAGELGFAVDAPLWEPG